jgi:hypothetical protein
LPEGSVGMNKNQTWTEFLQKLAANGPLRKPQNRGRSARSRDLNEKGGDGVPANSNAETAQAPALAPLGTEYQLLLRQTGSLTFPAVISKPVRRVRNSHNDFRTQQEVEINFRGGLRPQFAVRAKGAPSPVSTVLHFQAGGAGKHHLATVDTSIGPSIP